MLVNVRQDEEKFPVNFTKFHKSLTGLERSHRVGMNYITPYPVLVTVSKFHQVSYKFDGFGTQPQGRYELYNPYPVLVTISSVQALLK